jgi:hypothetical protein
MDVILEHVLGSSEDHIPRYEALIEEAIKRGDLPDFPSRSGRLSSKKKKSKAKRRSIVAAEEEEEAAELARELGFGVCRVSFLCVQCGLQDCLHALLLCLFVLRSSCVIRWECRPPGLHGWAEERHPEQGAMLQGPGVWAHAPWNQHTHSRHC